MTVTEAEAWARLRLVQGRSSAALWELVGKRGQAALTVGASAGCNWVVRHGGVAEVHFSLRWDGHALGIADTHGAGNLRVDGTPVGRDWQWLSGQARIDFGQAVMLVETSRGGAIDQGRPVDHTPSPTRSERPGRSSRPPVSEPERAPKTVAKSTLRAVAARAVGRTSSPPIVASQPLNPSPSPPAAVPGADGSLVLTLSNESRRAPRPTLQGMASADSSVPPAYGGPSSGVRSGGGQPSLNPTLLGVGHGDPTLHGVRHGEPTLLGVGHGDQPRDGATRQTQPLGAASLADGDQRTKRGFSTGAGASAPPVTVTVGGSASSSHPPGGRRDAQRGGDSGPPGAAAGAVVRGRIRPISDPAPPPDPPQVAPGHSGGAAPFQAPAVPIPPLDAHDVPMAVLFDAAAPSPAFVGGFPDGPTAMDDLSSPGASRPRRPFPWQYVFVAALTVVAYVAWLYLLEHF